LQKEGLRSEGSKFHNLEKFQVVVDEFIRTPGDVNYNMGSGDMIVDKEHWINVDKFTTGKGQVPMDMSRLGNPDESIDKIMCVHALDHLQVRQALATLQLWHSKLRAGGELLVAVTDLEVVCKLMIQKNSSYEQKWFSRLCMYGYQVDKKIHMDNGELTHPASLGEFHLTGWTPDLLSIDLKMCGFENIKEFFTCDCWGIPSILVHCIK